MDSWTPARTESRGRFRRRIVVCPLYEAGRLYAYRGASYRCLQTHAVLLGEPTPDRDVLRWQPTVYDVAYVA